MQYVGWMIPSLRTRVWHESTTGNKTSDPTISIHHFSTPRIAQVPYLINIRHRRLAEARLGPACLMAPADRCWMNVCCQCCLAVQSSKQIALPSMLIDFIASPSKNKAPLENFLSLPGDFFSASGEVMASSSCSALKMALSSSFSWTFAAAMLCTEGTRTESGPAATELTELVGGFTSDFVVWLMLIYIYVNIYIYVC